MAINHIFRALKPEGVVLATVPGITQISRYDFERWGDFWRFTSMSVKRLFSSVFQEKNIHVEAYGNIATATAFLYGVAAEEISSELLSMHAFDPEQAAACIGELAINPKHSDAFMTVSRCGLILNSSDWCVCSR